MSSSEQKKLYHQFVQKGKKEKDKKIEEEPYYFKLR